MKKVLSTVVTMCVFLSMIVSLPLCVSAAPLSVVNNKLPTTMKVGQILPYGSDYATVKNLLPEEEFMGGAIIFDGAFWNIGPSEAKGGATGAADKNGSANIFCEPCMAYRPETVNASVEIYFYGNDAHEDGSSKFATIKIEQPIITHNAPLSVKSGSSVNFTTAITNTAYSNSKISNHKDNEPFYTPFVEIIEGNNIVTRSNQDYTNTLCTSETLTFNNSGSVTLKIRYQPTVYQVFAEGILIDETLEVWKQSKEVIDYKKQGGQAVLIYLDGSVEEIVTINVTEDSKPDLPSSDSHSSNTNTTSTGTTPPTSSSIPDTESTSPNTNPPTSSSVPDTESTSSEETSTSAVDNTVIIADPDTGIKIEGAIGVVPSDTVIRVKEVKDDGNFTIVNNALEQISDKWVAFDISLLSSGTEIQPNGKVKITMPRPQGLNVNNMILYHVAEDMTLTQIPFTLDDNRNNLIFETEHFSLYAVAEVAAVDGAIAGDNQNHEIDNLVLWVVLLVASVVMLVGAGISVWYFKFRKKPTENE